MKVKSICYLLLIMVMASAALAQSIPLDPKLRTGQLKNGFTYYIRSNNQPAQRAHLYLVNDVGSILEDDDQLGLAHFMEHMNFNGTKNFPRNALIDYLQRAGVRFGADLNAHTGFDETVYELPIPTNEPRLLAGGLQILRDWAQEAVLDPAEIDRERGVIIEEGRLIKGAKDRMSRQYLPMLLNDSRYAQRFPIGKDSILLNFKPETLRRFHQDWYRPDLQALIVVGDINVDEVEKQVHALFSDLKQPVKSRKRTRYTIPPKTGRHFLAVTDPEQTTTTFELMFKRPENPVRLESEYLESINSKLLAELIATRTQTETGRESSPAYTNMSIGIHSFMGGTAMLVFSVTAKDGQLETAVLQGWQILQRIVQYGFSEQELQQAKRNYMQRLQRTLDEKDNTPSLSYVNEYKKLYLSGEAAPGIEWEHAFATRNLPKINSTSVLTSLKKYYSLENFDALLLSPQKHQNTLPDSTKVYSWLKGSEGSNVSRFVGERAANSIMSRPPVPGSIVSKFDHVGLGITELKLSNGMRVVLKATNFNNAQILFKGTAAGGTSIYEDHDFDNALNAAPLVSRFGLDTLSRVQLNHALSGKSVNVYPTINPRTQTITGAADVKDIETALQLTHLYMSRPKSDENVFRNTINNSKETLSTRYNDPIAVFSDTIAHVSGRYAYRHSPITPERMDKVKLSRVMEIYRSGFADASAFTFVFVGNIDQKTLYPLIERYLAGLPSTYSKPKARDLGIYLPKGNMIKRVYAGSEDKSMVRMVFSGNYSYKPENNIMIKALGDILQFRVLQRLREAAGEVYSPAVQTAYAKLPRNRYSIIVSFGCAPQNADHLMGYVKEEMDKMIKHGVSEDELLKFKKAYAKNLELALRDNGFWLNFISGQFENNEPLNEVSDGEKHLVALTTAKLKKGAIEFLSGENTLSFVLLPKSL